LNGRLTVPGLHLERQLASGWRRGPGRNMGMIVTNVNTRSSLTEMAAGMAGPPPALACPAARA